MKQRVTMTEIARRANVHVSTVSMALRNHPQISATTKERIRALAADMGFRPDPALAALMAYRRSVRLHHEAAPLAYITNAHTRSGWQDMPAQAQFFAGATARARELGYAIEHFWLGEPNLTHRRMSDILRARGIKGLIFAAQLRQSREELQFEWPEFAAAKIDLLPPRPPLHLVTNDQRGNMQLVLQRLRDEGYSRPGLVMPGWWDTFANLAWSAGFLAEQQYLPPSERVPVLRYEAPFPVQAPALSSPVPRDRLESWLEQHQPDVLVSHSAFVLPSLEEIGCSVPHDLPFVDLCLRAADGTIAGVCHNCERVGEVAVELVSSQLQQNAFGLPRFPTLTLVAGSWHDGRSLPSPTAAACRDAEAIEIAS